MYDFWKLCDQSADLLFGCLVIKCQSNNALTMHVLEVTWPLNDQEPLGLPRKPNQIKQRFGSPKSKSLSLTVVLSIFMDDHSLYHNWTITIINYRHTLLSQTHMVWKSEKKVQNFTRCRGKLLWFMSKLFHEGQAAIHVPNKFDQSKGLQNSITEHSKRRRRPPGTLKAYDRMIGYQKM